MSKDRGSEGNDFDRWLTDQLGRNETYLDDNGFTDTVMGRLPRRRLGDLATTLIPALTLLVTSVLVFWHFPVLGLLIDMGVSLSMLSSPVMIAGGLLFIVLTSGMGIWALKRNSL